MYHKTKLICKCIAECPFAIMNQLNGANKDVKNKNLNDFFERKKI